MRSQLGTHESQSLLKLYSEALMLLDMLDVRKALQLYSMVNDDRWLLFTRNVDRGGTSRIKW